MKKIVATNTRYPEDIYHAMLRLAEQHRRSFNAEVMWALQHYVEREEKAADVSDTTREHRQDTTP